MLNNQIYNDFTCNVCNKRISVFTCRICNTEICNYCCDKIQLGQKTDALSIHNINYDRAVEQCIKCKKYIRKEGYEIQCNPEKGLGYVCHFNNYDGYLIFSSDIYKQQRKLLEFILDKEVKTLEDSYMIAQCCHIINKNDMAYDNIQKCISNINDLKDKSDKAEVYSLFFSICMRSNKVQEVLEYIDIAIKLNYNTSLFYSIKADLFSKLCRWREAYNYYKIALRFFDYESTNRIQYIYLGLAVCLLNLNEYDEARDNLNFYIEEIGGNDSVIEVKRKLDEGIKIQALSYDMDIILDVYHMYVAIYLEKCEYKLAEKYLEYSFIISPNDLENKFLEGRVVQAKKMYKENQELFKKYAQLLESKVQNINYYGDVKMRDVNFNGTVNTSVLSTGDNANINYHEKSIELKDIEDLIRMINSQISSLTLNNDEKKVLNEKLIELEREKKDSRKCKDIIKSIKNIIEGATESIIATGILTVIGQILS